MNIGKGKVAALTNSNISCRDRRYGTMVLRKRPYHIMLLLLNWEAAASSSASFRKCNCKLNRAKSSMP